MVKERCPLWSPLPLILLLLESKFLGSSVLFSSHLLDPCCPNLVRYSFTCLMPSLWSLQSHFSPLFIIHVRSNYTQPHFRVTILPPCRKPRMPHSHEPSSDLQGFHVVATQCQFDVPTLDFSALVRIITLPAKELYLLFYIFHSFRSIQIRHTIQVLWPLLASLVNELLDIHGIYNLVWVWRTLNKRQTPRLPLVNLNAIRLVSFLQQGTLYQEFIIICLDKILICLMNLAL